MIVKILAPIHFFVNPKFPRALALEGEFLRADDFCEYEDGTFILTKIIDSLIMHLSLIHI